MKRIKMLFALAIVCTAGYSSYNAYQTATMSDAKKLIQANVEALTNSEGDFVNLCNTHCWNSSGYVRVLETNYGFNINCDEMIAWNTSPR